MFLNIVAVVFINVISALSNEVLTIMYINYTPTIYHWCYLTYCIINIVYLSFWQGQRLKKLQARELREEKEEVWDILVFVMILKIITIDKRFTGELFSS